MLWIDFIIWYNLHLFFYLSICLSIYLSILDGLQLLGEHKGADSAEIVLDTEYHQVKSLDRSKGGGQERRQSSMSSQMMAMNDGDVLVGGIFQYFVMCVFSTSKSIKDVVVVVVLARRHRPTRVLTWKYDVCRARTRSLFRVIRVSDRR